MPVRHTKNLWEKPAHTEMKHKILRGYLNAWLPILSSWNGRVAVIDGFAGPGEYVNPDNSSERIEGSPLIILESITSHVQRNSFKEIVVLFIERNETYYKHLSGLLERRYPPEALPNIRYQIVNSDFASTLTEIIDDLSDRSAAMAPCFAFIDPFGVSGIPMELISKFMENEKSEVLINFAYDPLNRWLSQPLFEDMVDALFQCEDWRDIREEKSPKIRKQALLEKYLEQLRKVGGIVYTLTFEMKDINNRTTYFLVFGTKHIKGLNLMKQSMWKIAPSGEFAFSDYHYKTGKISLFPEEPDFENLSGEIYINFRGEESRIGDVENWVILNTQYCSNHVRRALTLLLESKKLERYNCIWSKGKWVRESTYTRKGAFPKDILLVFI